MAAGDYQLIWVAQGGGGTSGTVNLSQLAQGGATTGQVILWNGSAWSAGTVAGGSGITTLTGDVSATGTGSVPATVNQVGGVLASSIAAGANSANSATSSNAVSTIVKRDSSGNFSAGTINAAITGSAASITGTLPLSQLATTGATSGQALLYNGTAWAPGTVSGGGGTISSLTGDVTASGTGAVAATVASVGGSSASAVNTATTAANAATNTNTASTIVKRDASGNFSAGTITASLTGNATNITGNLPLSQLAQGGATTGQAILWSGTAWGAGTVSGGGGSGITALTGDVTASGTGSVAATVASVGGSTASAVNTATVAANNATNANTASTIVKRDASGNFSAGTITASLAGSATSITGSLALSQLAPGGASTGQAILYNGTTWGPYSLTVITSLTGDVTTSSSGAAAATVVSVGGSSAANVNTATGLVVGSKSANTFLAAPNGSAGSITNRLIVPADVPVMVASGTSHAAGLAPDPGSTAGTTRYLREDATWATPAGGGGSGITALTGDVTASGTGSVAATVAGVGGQTASFVATGAAAANNAQVSASLGGYIVARDTTGASNFCNAVYTLNGSSITANSVSSGVTYLIASGTNTVTLPANPTGVSLSYRIMGYGGTITVAPPATGTTPTFYYWGGSTTGSFTNNNQNTANYIEIFGIPGTSNYILTNIQGNWQSGGTPLGVFSSFSYPSTNGYVLTANGNTGLASFAAPSGGNVNHTFTQSGLNFASLAASTNYTFNSPMTYWTAPASGTLTRIAGGICARSPSPGGQVALTCYKNATYSTGGTTISGGTLIGSSGTVTGPAANSQIYPNTSISTSNTFAAGDRLFPAFSTGTGSSSSGSYDVSITLFFQTALQ